MAARTHTLLLWQSEGDDRAEIYLVPNKKLTRKMRNALAAADTDFRMGRSIASDAAEVIAGMRNPEDEPDPVRNTLWDSKWLGFLQKYELNNRDRLKCRMVAVTRIFVCGPTL